MRAQKSTVPVAFTPKFGEPGVFEVAPDEDEEDADEDEGADADEELGGELAGLDEEEHPAAATSRKAAAE